MTTDPALAADTRIDQATDRLLDAARTGVPCAPVRDLIGDTDIDTAYAVQHRLTEARLADGARVVGRKIGLTSPAVQQQLGVDRPDFGVLFDDMDVTALEQVPSERLLQPKAEAEVAFVLGEDLDRDDLDLAVVRAAVDHAVAALEIVDSRVAGWDISHHRHRRRQRLQRPVRPRRHPRPPGRVRAGRGLDEPVRRRRARLARHRRSVSGRSAQRAAVAGADRARVRRAVARRAGRALRSTRPDGPRTTRHHGARRDLRRSAASPPRSPPRSPRSSE